MKIRAWRKKIIQIDGGAMLKEGCIVDTNERAPAHGNEGPTA